MKVNPLNDASRIYLAENSYLERLCYDESGKTYTLNRLIGRKGESLKMHSHPHRQVEYMVSGQGEFVIGEEKQILKAGDVVTIEPDVPHTFTRFDEDTVALEFFTPIREDFIP